MTIFAVIRQPGPNTELLARAVLTHFPSHYDLGDGIWLISANGTASDIAAKLGVTPEGSPAQPSFWKRPRITVARILRFGPGLRQIGEQGPLAKPPRSTAPTTPQEFPQVEPQELFPSNNIRFVMWETAKLTERVDNLAAAIEKLGPSFEKSFDKHAIDMKERIGEVKADVKDGSAKIVELEKKVSFVKGATWVLGGLFAVAVVLLGVIARALLS